MRILRLRAESFGCFRSAVEVQLDPARLNLLYAPNGTGKSTLLKALSRAFFTAHDSRAAEVLAHRPWGTALAPAVEVEFDHQGRRYRLEKRFLESRLAALQVWQGGAWSPVAQGKNADEMLRGFFGAETGRRATQSQWLASVLWAPQGQLAFEDVEAPVVARVQGALGAQLDPEPARRLLKAIEDTAGEMWPPIRRELKKNSEAAQLARRRDECAAQVEAWRAKLDEIARLASTIEELETERLSKQQELVGLRERLAQLVKDRAQADALDRRLAPLRLELQMKRDTAQRLQRAVQTVSGAARTANTARAEIEPLAASLGAEPQARLAALAREWEQVRVETRDAIAWQAQTRELQQIRERLARLEELDNKRRELRAKIHVLLAPDEQVLAEIKKLRSDADKAEAELSGALLKVAFTAESPRPVLVESGEPAGEQMAAPGETLWITGSPEVALRLEGVGRLQVRGPRSSAAELKAKLTDLRERLGRLCAPCGTESVEELERRTADRQKASTELGAADESFKSESGGKTVEQWRESEIEFRAALLMLGQQHPAWKTQRPDADALQAREAELEKEHKALAGACERLGQLTSDLARAEENRHKALAEQGVVTEEELQARAAEAAADSGATAQQVSELEAQRQALPPDLAQQVEATERRIAEPEERLRVIGTELSAKHALLDDRLGEAPYKALGEAETQLAELRRRHEEEQLRADALLLLRDTARQCRHDMLEDVTGPVSQRATELLHQVAGESMGTLKLGSGLTPDQIAPLAAGEQVGLDVLSGGETEQVHFATRLALAELLAREEPQLAVFDDVWMATDDSRLARILDLLEARRERLQVLILTCHPERYRRAGRNFHEIDLAAAR
jgi:DNA repair exonuclease SbcCD ATPase subunit